MTLDYIAAEDTRQTLKLLNHYGIRKPLISCYEHNEKQRAREIMDLMQQGLSKKEAVKRVADDMGIAESEVYKDSINIKG